MKDVKEPEELSCFYCLKMNLGVKPRPFPELPCTVCGPEFRPHTFSEHVPNAKFLVCDQCHTGGNEGFQKAALTQYVYAVLRGRELDQLRSN